MRKLLLGAILLFSNLCISQEQQKDTLSLKPVKTLKDYLSNEDKFTGEKTYYSPTTTISIAKFVQRKSSNQYISIDVPGSTLNYGCYGVSILFENGKKIVRSHEKVETAYSDGWSYRAFFTPNSNEINLLKSYKVVAVKLYIYDADVNSREADDLLESAKVMLSTPKIVKKTKK